MEKYKVTGMTCSACSAHVEKAVKNVEGVASVAVSLLTNSMVVEGSAPSSLIIQAVQKAGYQAELADKSKSKSGGNDPLRDSTTPKIRNRFIISLTFLLPLMYVSMGYTMWGWPLPDFLSNNYLALGLIQLLLTIVVMVINQNFFINGFKSIIHRSLNMDTLVSLGSLAAFIYSTYVLFLMTSASSAGNIEQLHHYLHDLYFESAAMILTLITLGKMLESYSKGRTTDALKSLMKLTPKEATIIKDNQEVIVTVEDLKIGDIFVVKPGESIPVDGLILEGHSAIDESALTGESIPVDKKIKDKVFQGTINQSGFIRCEVSKVGEDTTINQIIAMVSDAASSKAPIAKIADKVSGVFVPIVICIALVTLFIWLLAGKGIGYSLARAISVLVISCPCALGLATPVAIMVGNGRGAKQGILFKNATALEVLGKTQILALDKTGTLTIGKPEVTDIIPLEGVSNEELLKVAFSLEKKSEHPLAKAIIKYGETLKIEVEPSERFEALPGNGVSAIINGKKVIGGSKTFIKDFVKIPDSLNSTIDELANRGKTPLFFSVENKLLGVIAVADVLKDNASKVIADIKSLGIKTVMITGDNNKTALAIGKEVGVDQVISDALPSTKETHVLALSNEGKVAMVGDGINDALALTRADVGIAIGAGTDVAIDAADVVLIKSDLEDLATAIRLSRKVLKNIKENLFWAFIYNLIGIPLAAGLFIPLFHLELNPMFGAAAMSLSSFSVVLNALRLNLVKISPKVIKNKIEVEDNIENKEEKDMVIENMNKVTVFVDGMMCSHCESRVKKTLESLVGVSEVTVDLASKAAVVTYQGELEDQKIKDVITAQGYSVIEIKR